jgi:hypothetical protein
LEFDVSPTPPVNQGSPVRCVRNRMDSPKKSPHNSPVSTDRAIVKVHFPNGGFNIVKYGDTVDVKGIISTVTERLSIGERYYTGLYAMRLCRPSTGEVHWLHQDLTMKQVQEKYLAKHPNSEWRYDLRIRYLPTSLQDLCDKDKVTFHYYHDQVLQALIFLVRFFHRFLQYVYYLRERDRVVICCNIFFLFEITADLALGLFMFACFKGGREAFGGAVSQLRLLLGK